VATGALEENVSLFYRASNIPHLAKTKGSGVVDLANR
jgi:hypothetical protein